MNGNPQRDWKLLVGKLAVSIAIVLSTLLAVNGWVHVKTRKVRTIEVTGSAKTRIQSDLVEWQATVSTQATERKEAYRSLHEDVDKARAYLKAQGVQDDEIRVSSVMVEEQYDTEYVGVGEERVARTVLKGYETSQEIRVTSTRVAEIERLSREITQLLEEGVSVTSWPPSYFYTKLGELKITMLAEASKDARARAEHILDSAGTAKLGRLVDADMGVINVNPANSTSTSWNGNNDTSSLEKDVITIVHCTFEMQGDE